MDDMAKNEDTRFQQLLTCNLQIKNKESHFYFEMQ